MDRIAYIVGETFIYWNSIILAFGALTAVCIFLWLYLGRSGNGLAAALMVPMSVTASLVLSRLVHWYCRTDAYESFSVALGDFSQGGYALLGVFMGCVLVACLLRLFGITRNLPELLDSLALAGGAGIAVGRLACLFSAADRGVQMPAELGLPLVYPVANAVTGDPEYRLATFMLQAIITGTITVLLIGFYLFGKHRKKLKDGDTCLMFLAAYCTAQAVLDSTRYDSLFFRSNGFVGMVQVLSAVMLVATIVIFSVRMVRARKWHWGFLAFWVSIGGLLGLAGYMEYYVQRHGDQALFAYSVMSSCLFCVLVLCYVIRFLAVRAERGEAKLREKVSRKPEKVREPAECKCVLTSVKALWAKTVQKLKLKPAESIAIIGEAEEMPVETAAVEEVPSEEEKPAEEPAAEEAVTEEIPAEPETPAVEEAPAAEETPAVEAVPEEAPIEAAQPVQEVPTEAEEQKNLFSRRFRTDKVPLSIRIPPILKTEKKEGKFAKLKDRLAGKQEDPIPEPPAPPAPEPEEEYIETAEILSELDRVLGEDAKPVKKKKKKK